MLILVTNRIYRRFPWLSRQRLKHPQQPGRDLFRGLDLYPVGSQPGLVPPQSMLSGRRQVTVPSVRQLDGEGILKRGLTLDLQACFRKRFKGNGCNTRFANLQRL